MKIFDGKCLLDSIPALEVAQQPTAEGSSHFSRNTIFGHPGYSEAPFKVASVSSTLKQRTQTPNPQVTPDEGFQEEGRLNVKPFLDKSDGGTLNAIPNQMQIVLGVLAVLIVVVIIIAKFKDVISSETRKSATESVALSENKPNNTESVAFFDNEPNNKEIKKRFRWLFWRKQQ